MYFQRGKFHSNSDLAMQTRSGTEEMLEASVFEAAGMDLPAAQRHYLHVHSVALSYGKARLMPRTS